MTLREKQSLFARLVADLIIHAYTLGYEITFGDTYRSKEEAERLNKLGLGIKKSLHTKRLAIDINLFKNGKYLNKTDDHKILGEFWEGLHPLCRWGGRFRDGNHYSITHGGIK